MIYLKLDNDTEDIIQSFTDLDLKHGLGFNEAEKESVYYFKTTTPPPMEYRYLTFISQKNNNTFKFSGSTASNTLQYSLDGGKTWETLAHNTDSPAVKLEKQLCSRQVD